MGFVHQKCSHQQKVLVWESHMSCSANEERLIFNWRHQSTDHSVEKAGSPPILTSSQFSDPFSKHSASTLDSSDKGSNSFWNKIGWSFTLTTVFNPSSLLAAQRDSRVQVVAYSIQVQCLQSLQTLINQSLSQTWWLSGDQETEAMSWPLQTISNEEFIAETRWSISKA